MPTEVSSFKYASEPKPVKGKTKYRNENDMTLTLMSDPRVARGNTHSLARKVALAAQTKAANAPLDAPPGKTAKNTAAQERVDQLPFPTYFYEPTTFAGDGLDVLKYCEEDPATTFVAKNDEATQSDAFVPRPESPPYVPKKTGIDCATQIEDQTELFNFDMEVQPMLNIIVDKTIQQSLFELRSEAELLSLREAADEFRKKKAAELEWMKEREQQVANELNAKRSLVDEKKREQEEQMEVRKLIAGRLCFKQILPSVVDEAFEELYRTGEWEDATEVQVKGLMPQLSKDVVKTHERRVQTEALVDDILTSAREKFEATHFVPKKRPGKVVIALTLPAGKINGGTEDKRVGPFELNPAYTIGDLVADVDKQLKAAEITTTSPIDAAMLQSYISSCLGRRIAVDAPMMNFEMPSSLTVVV